MTRIVINDHVLTCLPRAGHTPASVPAPCPPPQGLPRRFFTRPAPVPPMLRSGGAPSYHAAYPKEVHT